ncbi:hypothetical protein [Nocardioides sp.]|uniref:hypothetical protein n=1 Tax=Nocardioides sp. TaxID=35761 RepID=UPI003514007C
MALVVAGVLLLGGGEEPYVARIGDAAPTGPTDGDVAAVVAALGRAIDAHDPATAAALGVDPTAGERLAQLARNADAADLGVSLRLLDRIGGVAPDGTVAVSTEVRWRYRGVDRAEARAEMQVQVRGAPGAGATVVTVGGGDLATPIWAAGPISVSAEGGVLVVAQQPRDPAGYLPLARRAVPQVAAVVSGWSRSFVLEVPADAAALESTLDVEPGYYTQIAAVTGSPDGVNSATSPIHILLNPEVFDGLGTAARQVVLTHELAHLATRAPRSGSPLWLIEGFADYVALRDTTLPLATTARQIAARVRADGVPRALPSAADFDTRGPHLGAVYEGAWLLCVTIADRAGQDGLVALYDAVDAGADPARALRRAAGWSEAQLLGAWQQRLRSLPGAG